MPSTAINTGVKSKGTAPQKCPHTTDRQTDRDIRLYYREKDRLTLRAVQSRRSALTTCKTSNKPTFQYVTRAARTAGSRLPTNPAVEATHPRCRRTSIVGPRSKPGPRAQRRSTPWGGGLTGGLFWRLSSRRSTHAVRPARPGIRSTQSPRPPVNPPPAPAWRVCARRCAELCRPSSDDHEHDEEDELAHAAAQVVRGEERLEEAACRAERGGRGLTGARGARGKGACWRACRAEGASQGGGMQHAHDAAGPTPGRAQA